MTDIKKDIREFTKSLSVLLRPQCWLKKHKVYKTISNKNFLLFISFILGSALIYLVLNEVKNDTIKKFEQNNYVKTLEQTNSYVNSLIEEKKNANVSIAIALRENVNILDALKNNVEVNLKSISLEFRKNTNFKNVWISLLDKNGNCLQRSWSSNKEDLKCNKKEVGAIVQNQNEVFSTIKVDSNGLGFKAFAAVTDQDGEFIGILQITTHFNSIVKKLKDKGVSSVVLVDKSYKELVSKHESDNFIQDYYVESSEADYSIKEDLKKHNIYDYIKDIKKNKYILDKELTAMVGHYALKDSSENSIGHFMLYHYLEDFDTTKIDEIRYMYNMYILFGIVTLALVLYTLHSREGENGLYTQADYSQNINLLFTLIFFFVVLSLLVYFILKYELDNDIQEYKQNLKSSVQKEYEHIYRKNKDISKLVFSTNIDTHKVKTLFKSKDRVGLYNHLLVIYPTLKDEYNIRQLHFHLSDSTSFLRMHKPSKYGDNLKKVRPSVNYVNEKHKFYEGFEEGRIFNGFRFVYPLFLNGEYLGSVEVSFSAGSFIDNYMKDFHRKRISFIIKDDVVSNKVFKDEQRNYLKSPYRGFMFDKNVISKLSDVEQELENAQRSDETLKIIQQKLQKEKTFVINFKNMKEITTFIPLVNKYNEKVVGSILVTDENRYIQQRTKDFNILSIVFIGIIFILTILIYRELLFRSKNKTIIDNNKRILDSQKSIIIITDGKNLKVANREFLDFFGVNNLSEFKKEHDCICDFFEYVEGKDYLQKTMMEQTWLEHICSSTKEYNVQISGIDGSSHIFKINYQPYSDISDEKIVTFIDISEQVKTQEDILQAKQKAQKANEAKSEFLANMSHEIRTPLNGIIGLTDIVLDTNLNEMQKDYLLKAKQSSRSLLSIINDILDYSKIEAGKLDIVKDSFYLSDILNNISHLFGYKINEKGLEFNFTLDPKINHILIGDNLRITQVLNNFIGNAIKFTDNGFIHLDVKLLEKSQDKMKLEFKVNDSGIGIAKENQDKLFNAFNQEDSSTTKNFGGTGLGLAISKQLVELMDGYIIFNSIKGHGSTFGFVLELEYGEKILNFDEQKNKFQNKTFLVIDDNEIDREYLCEILNSWGIKSIKASSGVEALDILDKKGVDYLLIDWYMPELDGISLLEKIQSKKLNIPNIFMITANSKKEFLKKAKRSNVNVDKVLEKPYTPSELYYILFDQKAHDFDHEVKRIKLKEAKKVLVAEDNETNQIVAKSILEDIGFSVEFANDGIESVKIAEKNSYDMIFMDLQMPNMDGFEATKNIREFDTVTPIVALSAAVMKKDKELTKEVGMDEHLAKPIIREDLEDLIKKYFQVIDKDGLDEQKSDTQLNLRSIDMDELLNRVNANQELVEKMLLQFYNSYKDKIQLLKEIDVESKEFDDMMHALKGVTGNMSMTELYTLSKEIYESKDAEFKKSKLPEFISSLKKMLEQIEQLKPTDTTPKNVANIDKKEADKIIQKYNTLLEKGDYIDSEGVTELINAVSTLAPNDLVIELKNLIEVFAYDKAKDILLGLKE